MFHLRRWLLPVRKLLREFRTWDFCLFSFPALQVVRGRGGVSRCTWYCVPEGFLPSRWISVQRVGWECFWTIVCCARARSCFTGEGGVARSQQTSLARYAPLLSLTFPRRTLDDVGNCGRLRRTAPACYPLVVPDLRIVEHGRIRELVHSRVVFVDRGRLFRSRSSSR